MNLFEEFDEVSAKQWKQKIQFDLKGADYNETLIWKSHDGVDVKPFYHPDESPAPIYVETPEKWDICEKIYVANVEKSNQRAREVLQKGAESLWFIIPSEKIYPKMLFLDIDFETIPIYLDFEFLSSSFFSELKKYLSGKKHLVHLNLDIVGNLARSGNWFHSLNEDHKLLKEIIQNSEDFQSILSIDASLYQNSGANIPQQLAYALAHANEYLNYFGKDEMLKHRKMSFLFKISVGSNYFFEIAKLRALRAIFASLAKEYEVSEKCFILAQPSKRNKSLYDYNINMLRSTTESMSAILGGADSICNMAYNEIFHKSNEFGSRIARNQLIILKEESYFEKASNAAEGTYYIESLTRQFAEKALEIFKEIEKGGGFLTQLKEGIIQKKIAKSAAREQEEFDSGKLVLVGANKFQNAEDKMRNELEIFPFLKHQPRKTLISPILEKRLTEKLEQQRLETEK